MQSNLRRNRWQSRFGAAYKMGIAIAVTAWGGLASAQTTVPKAAAPSLRVKAATGVSVVMRPFRDPWPAGRQRFWDISDHAEQRFDAFLNGSQKFNYQSSYPNSTQRTQVTLTYDKAPGVPYFVAHIEAVGLKPNFAYQIKLAGKPTYGRRGHGPSVVKDASGHITTVADGGGEDWANEQLGKAGRWWCDTSHATQTNFDDSHYFSAYKNAAVADSHSMYGYIYVGMFVTNARGEASIDFTSRSSYHITWAGWQGGIQDVEDYFSPFSIAGHLIKSAPTTYYGYGTAAPMNSVRLFYEYEPGRARNNVRLPPGLYRCRVMLTEESFHNSPASPEGGYWKGVLINEDHAYDSVGNLLGPDTIASNDITFRIGNVSAPAAPQNLSATARDGQVALAWTPVAGATYYRIKRATIEDGPYLTIAGGFATAASTFIDDTVTVGTKYFYVVSAVASGVEGAESVEASTLSPLPAVPLAPTALTATAVSSSRISLKWRDNANNEDGFKIERSIDGVKFLEIKWVGPNVTAYGNTSLNAAATYIFRVRAYHAGGDSAYSNTARARTLQ